MTTSSQTTEKSYFDLHTTGLGFLKRIREVTPGGRKRDAFLACAVSALTGTGENPTYRYFDVRVSGSKAQELVRNYASDVEAGRPVLIQFRIGDAFSGVFTRTTGDKAGMPDATLKGRLLTATALELSVLQQMVQHRLQTRGLGYVNRIRHDQRDPAVRHCTLAVLNGPKDEPEYRYVDVDVTDPEVVALLDQYAADVQAKRKVLVSFRLEDLEASFFTRTKGESAGEHSPVMRSTLSYIGTIKVDKEERYRDPSKAAEPGVQPDQDVDVSQEVAIGAEPIADLEGAAESASGQDLTVDHEQADAPAMQLQPDLGVQASHVSAEVTA
ncbi:DUF3577 domain-containing protein [Pseudomonas aeruginosa]